MAAAGIFSLFSNFLSIFILLLHLGCFTFKSNHNHPPKKRRVSPLSPNPSISSSSSQSRLKLQSRKAISSSISYLKRIFSSAAAKQNSDSQSPLPTLTSARSSYQSIVNLVPIEDQPFDIIPQSNIAAASDQFFPLRNDIFPCTVCGEIFQKPQLLETHQSVKHAVSELSDGDSGKNIVYIIFKTGWGCKEKNPEINRILKIHNSPKILSRFEEYREVVKAKAARNGGVRRRDERCIADGNELLRFYCATFMCDLGQNGNSNVCNQQYCSVCGIIKSGFSGKMEGICTLSSSYRAHVAVPEDIEEEFKFMNVKRAMLVCRVVAGRVGSDEEEIMMMKEDGGCDSLLARSDGESGVYGRLDEEELIVLNPRAVLPCFVIVYTV